METRLECLTRQSIECPEGLFRDEVWELLRLQREEIEQRLPNCYRCACQPCECADGITLYHGDARDILPLLEPGSVDLVLTDPPYGIDKGKGTLGKRGRAASNTWADTVEDVRTVYAPAFVQSLQLADGRGVITPGASNAFEYPKPRDIGAILQPAATGVSPWGRATWQPVLFYGDDPFAGKHLKPITFTQIRRSEKNGHPCPKPLAVIKWLVERASRPDETILDPFAGSGTTGRACKDLGRRCIMVEIEQKYCEITARRLDQEVGHWMK